MMIYIFLVLIHLFLIFANIYLLVLLSEGQITRGGGVTFIMFQKVCARISFAHQDLKLRVLLSA